MPLYRDKISVYLQRHPRAGEDTHLTSTQELVKIHNMCERYLDINKSTRALNFRSNSSTPKSYGRRYKSVLMTDSPTIRCRLSQDNMHITCGRSQGRSPPHGVQMPARQPFMEVSGQMTSLQPCPRFYHE